MSQKSKLEYIWLDGFNHTKSKNKTMVRRNFKGNLDECPMWSFDGSSTHKQMEMIRLSFKTSSNFPDPDRSNGFLVMTEVLNADGSPQHLMEGQL